MFRKVAFEILFAKDVASKFMVEKVILQNVTISTLSKLYLWKNEDMQKVALISLTVELTIFFCPTKSNIYFINV